MILYYPQLATGSISQYPLTRRNARRTVVNTLADGSGIRMADEGAATAAWELGYAHLAFEELNAIQQLFEATSGRWQTFTFLDPTANLLTFSEDLSQPSWEVDPLLTPAGGVTDPFGGTGATRVTNTAQAPQGLRQAAAIPGWYQYCFSLYVRADQPTFMDLMAANGGDQAHMRVTADGAWRRVLHSFNLSSHVDGLSVEIRLDPGQAVSIFGCQLEAQLGAGGYKKTRDRGGVYEAARFAEDALHAAATGVNQYSCTVKIVANEAG